MENTQNTQVINEVETVVDTNTGVETPTNDSGCSTTQQQTFSKTYSQEQVNDIVRARLERSNKRLYSRYGVENRMGLDEIVGKAQSYDVMKERLETLRESHASLSEELAFLKNNINPEKYEDIRAYFKGKGLQFNVDTFMTELQTHPEWVRPPIKENTTPVTTIKSLGAEQNGGYNADNEAEIASRLFGLSSLK